MSKISKAVMLIKSVISQPSLIGEGIRFVKKNGIRQMYSALAGYRGTRVLAPQKDGEDRKKYSGHIKFSILMPVYNVDTKWLEKAIESVKQQNYRNWQLCIVDDCSTDSNVRDYLSGIKDPKIRVKLLDHNTGISEATNSCAEIADGDFFLLMDNDDEIAPFALDEFYRALAKGDYDIIYSDQDIVDVNENHFNPTYKPDWSPDLLLSQMYIGHLVGFKADLFRRVGGFRSEFNGSQDYDLLLRMTAETDNIYHIPEILYSWRDIPTSTAANPESKPYAQTAGLNAIQSFLDTKYGKGYAEAHETEDLFVYDVRYTIPENTSAAIIIPTKDHADLLKGVIDSIEEKTEYENYHIYVLNNNSVEFATYEYFKKLRTQYSNVSVIDAIFEFNWSKLNNYAINLIDADVYVCLNNDMDIISGDWLTRLVENAVRPDVGTVGGLLLYEDGTIQHAGIVAGMGGWADHIYKGCKPVHYGSPFISPMVTRNVTAVTGACLAVSKATLKQIGTFDERYIICGSDVELSVRACRRGFYNVYCPYIKLHHYESKSRDSFIPDIDFKLSYEMYTPYRENGDPYYNINLDYNSCTPEVKKKTVIQNNKAKSDNGEKMVTADKYKVDEINPYKFIPESRERKRLNILVPSINPEHVFGGISTAIKFFKQLADFLGYDQRIILVDAVPSREALQQYRDYTLVSPGKSSDGHKQIVSYAFREDGGIPVSDKDYFMFTGWWTAHCAIEAYEAYERAYGKGPNEFLYFIQDFEPGFYPWSTRYLLAEATYHNRYDMIAVFNSKLLKDYFDNNGYKFKNSFYFEPVLNDKLKEKLLALGNSVSKKKTIFVYGRPSTERNAFSLVVSSLKKWSEEYEEASDWNIISAGEQHPDIQLSQGVVIKSVGKLTLDGYAELLGSAYTGISLMASPHPSYPPLEMASFGVRTITNSFSNKDLGSFNDFMISVDECTPTVISEKLAEICDGYNERVELPPQNTPYINGGNNFDFLDDIENIWNR